MTTWEPCWHEAGTNRHRRDEPMVPPMTAPGWFGARDALGGEDGDASGFESAGRMTRLLDGLRPDEGWASLPLVLLLTGTMAWSVADASWILGRFELTSFLILVAVVATFWGYISARLGLPPWLAQALGCVIGAFFLIEVIGASLPGAQSGLVGWFQATANSVTEAYLDLTWRHKVSTVQAGHFCLVLGVVVWGTAQAASYNIFGYHRAVNGVLLLTVVLIANMALMPDGTTRDAQYPGLVLFSAAILLLLLLSHAAEERSSWQRHRVWRGRNFEAPHMQGGVAFASVAVAGSLILTLFASSAPLGQAMKDLNTEVRGAWSGLGGMLPNGAASGASGSDFGGTAQVTSRFDETTRNVFTVRAPDVSTPFHWRMIAYDTFQTTIWSVGSGTHQDQVVAGDKVDGGTHDSVGLTTAGRRQISMTVHIQDTTISHVIVANEPDSVSAGVQRTLIGDDSSGVNVAGLSTKSTDYVVSAYVPDVNRDGSGLTEWRLQHAGKGYPSGLLDRYTQGVGSVGSTGKTLLTEIRDWAKKNGNAFDNEYDVAKAIQTYLRGSAFTYNTDITGLVGRCGGLSTVDCFATIRQGFCEQYATTMTMLMRLDGYPARYVLGYLPGAVDQNTLVDQVTTMQKHAWVEVFFPTYGWITFDPTGGGVGTPTTLVRGSAVVATPGPSQSIGPEGSNVEATPAASPTLRSGSGAASTSLGRGALLVAGILAGILGLALFVMWRRRSKRLQGPDAVYRDVVRLASRLGYKPKPTQTVYEYTGMLADVVPKARDSLGVVAMATVEVTYGKRQLGSDRLVSLAAAQHSVRQALLGLALRIPRLRRRSQGSSGPAKSKRGTGSTRT